MPLFQSLKQPKIGLTALLIAGGVYALNHNAMTKLPGVQDLQCVIGAGFTPANVIFSIVLSILTGILAVGIGLLIKHHALMKGVALTSLSGIGVIFGVFTVFCTLCTIPVISLFGLSIGLHAFTDYNIFFKVASLILISVGLYIIDKQLKDECSICKIDPKKKK